MPRLIIIPIVKLFVENNVDKSAINTAFKWGSIYDSSVRYYLLSIVQHNSLTKTREFEGALRLKDISKLDLAMSKRDYKRKAILIYFLRKVQNNKTIYVNSTLNAIETEDLFD